MSKSFTVASAKGGVGKTTTTANLGAAIAAAGHDVVLIDADIGMANLGTMLGIDPDGPTLHDVLASDANIEDAIYEGPCGMRVVPGSVELEAYGGVNPAGLREAVEELTGHDGYLLVDSSAGLSHDSSLPLALGDGTLLVSTPDRASLLDTEKTRELAVRLGGTVIGVALTRVEADHPMRDSVPEMLGTDVVAEIPEDHAVTEAAAAQEPLEVHAPHSPAAAAYRELARQLTGEEIPDPEAESEAEPEPEAEPELEAESEAEPEPEAKPEPEAESEPEAVERDDTEPPASEPVEQPGGEELDLEESPEDEQSESPEDERPGSPEDLDLEEPNESSDDSSETGTEPPASETEASEEGPETSTPGAEDSLEEPDAPREAESEPVESRAAESDADESGEVDSDVDAAASGDDTESLIAEAEPSAGGDEQADREGENASDEPEELEEPEEPDAEETEGEQEESEDEKKGGFLSRLFGR